MRLDNIFKKNIKNIFPTKISVTSIILIILIILLFYYRENIYVNYMTFFIVVRGIIAPNCFWWRMSELLLKDRSGVNLYNKIKVKSDGFYKINMFGTDIYLVTEIKYIKTILDNSPFLFGVGKLKNDMFRSFMKKNVGVSMGCPWKRRRKLNEQVLDTDQFHRYSNMYNTIIKNEVKRQKNYTNFDEFVKSAKIITIKIVFNDDKVTEEVFQMFSEANSIKTFFNKDFKVKSKISDKYISYIKDNINNPRDNSLVKLCTLYEKDKEEILYQIPHFIFPIGAIFNSNVPRLLLLLCNHPNIFKKLINEIKTTLNESGDESSKIYKMKYLRKCVLELLRLNNPVVSTFRTLLHNFQFDKKYTFSKGTQFLILNNPVLREKEFFDNPNKFIPERWTDEMEKSYYSISFNHGPQRCPGKELSIYLIQSFTVNLLIHYNVLDNIENIRARKIDTKNIPQMINPCNITFSY